MGSVATNFKNSIGNDGADTAHSVAIQADGKVVAAGTNGSAFALARYTADGRPDRSFGINGQVTTSVLGSEATINAVAIQSDGKIVAAGFGRPAYSQQFIVVRYNPDGSQDSTFGNGGVVTLPSFSTYSADVARAMVIQSDGKILVAGDTSGQATSFNPDIALARFNTNGTLDTTFGTGGVFTLDLSAPGEFRSADEGHGIALQVDGKVIVVGNKRSYYGGITDAVVLRFNIDGSLDNTFGNAGQVATDFINASDVFNAVRVQSDGKIVAAGATFTSTGLGGIYDYAVARYNQNGSLDTTFGNGGKVTTDFTGGQDAANSLLIQTDGKIVAAGIARNLNTLYYDYVFGVVRYNSDGSLDNTFATAGKALTAVSGSDYDEIFSVALQSNGKIIAVGDGPFGRNYADFALTRYNTNGSLDTSFGARTDLVLTMISSPASVQAGNNILYTLTLRNIGPDASDDVRLKNYLPAGVDFISVSSSAGTCSGSVGSPAVECAFNILEAASTVTVSITAQAAVSGAADNKATVYNYAAELDPSNNSASVSNTITGTADVAISIAPVPSSVKIGDVSYTVTVTNNGPNTATRVVVSDTPTLTGGNGYAYVKSASASQGGCSYSPCSLGSLARGASATVTFVVYASYNGTLTNRTDVTTGITDPNTANNTATSTTRVDSRADLAVKIKHSPLSPHLGQAVTYTVTLSNLGPDQATNVSVDHQFPNMVDGLPDNFSIPGGYCYRYFRYNLGPGISCYLSSLGSGASVDIVFTLIPQASTIVSTVEVSNSIPDPHSANNTDKDTLEVVGSADLALKMTATPDPVNVNDPITYTLTLTNNGPDPSYQVKVSDTINALSSEAGISYGSITSNQGYCGQKYYPYVGLDCDLGTIANGASVIISFQAIANVRGPLSNSATASSVVNDPGGARASVNVQVK